VARKEESIEDVARREASLEEELAKSRADSLARSQQLAKAVPERFFQRSNSPRRCRSASSSSAPSCARR
jgi:hypothetical protein